MKYEFYGSVLEIDQDDYNESPREWDNLGVMVCWHRSYKLGDEQPKCKPSEWQIPKGSVKLPLYLYDHSGITMNTTGFSCPWDSGQVGFIFASPQSIRKEYGVKRISKKLREKVAMLLKAEVETYDQYLTGDVYYGHFTNEDTDESCCGFYGDNHWDSDLIPSLVPKELLEAAANAVGGRTLASFKEWQKKQERTKQ